MHPTAKPKVPQRALWTITCVLTLTWAALLLGCGDGIHTATPGVTAPAVTTPPALSSLVVTHGGTYSGAWHSDDPGVPAVSVQTSEPVVIENALISSRGDVIQMIEPGATVTLRNVTGTGLDPKVAGQQRGSFVHATGVTSLNVEHCTIIGTRHGISLDTSSPAQLLIRYNSVADLEDRASDGAGGFQNARPDLGHFVVLHAVTAAYGAEISWNQVLQTSGHSSTEDGINLYKTQGTAANPITIHDNYFEGASSPATNTYSGNGLITDGDGAMPVSAFVVFEDNQIVHTAGGGVMIANGHDVTARNNRVVSCGKNVDGSWYARKQVTAISLWNYYGAPQFFNNFITGSAGGMVVPDGNGNPVASDIYANTADLLLGNTVSGNSFTDPCLSGTVLTLASEAAERKEWSFKVTASGNTLGNTTP